MRFLHAFWAEYLWAVLYVKYLRIKQLFVFVYQSVFMSSHCSGWKLHVFCLHVAMKCNFDPVILKMLAGLGIGFDCASKVLNPSFSIIIQWKSLRCHYMNLFIYFEISKNCFCRVKCKLCWGWVYPPLRLYTPILASRLLISG